MAALMDLVDAECGWKHINSDPKVIADFFINTMTWIEAIHSMCVLTQEQKMDMT